MPVISFVSSKGGAGKTTSSIILGSALARKHAVTMIDCDESLRLNKWANRSGEAINHIDVWAETDEYKIHAAIERANANSDYVIIDTKGEASRLNSYIIGESDLVIITTGEDYAEADDAVHTIGDVILESRALRREIPYVVAFTRVLAGNKSTVAREVNAEMRDKFECLDVELFHLSAFSRLYRDGGTVWDYSEKKFPKLSRAIDVAEMFAINVQAAVDWMSQDIKAELKKGMSYAKG